MHLKSPEQIISGLIRRYSTNEDNILYLNRLFIAASVVRWVFKQTSTTEEILQYLSQVERYLEGEIDLFWQDGVIKIGRVKRGK